MFLNIVCPNQIQKSLILQEKIAKFELSHQKNVLDECSSTLESFSCKLCAYFYFGQLMLYLVLWLRIREKF